MDQTYAKAIHVMATAAMDHIHRTFVDRTDACSPGNHIRSAAVLVENVRLLSGIVAYDEREGVDPQPVFSAIADCAKAIGAWHATRWTLHNAIFGQSGLASCLATHELRNRFLASEWGEEVWALIDSKPDQ